MATNEQVDWDGVRKVRGKGKMEDVGDLAIVDVPVQKEKLMAAVIKSYGGDAKVSTGGGARGLHGAGGVGADRPQTPMLTYDGAYDTSEDIDEEEDDIIDIDVSEVKAAAEDLKNRWLVIVYFYSNQFYNPKYLFSAMSAAWGLKNLQRCVIWGTRGTSLS